MPSCQPCCLQMLLNHLSLANCFRRACMSVLFQGSSLFAINAGNTQSSKTPINLVETLKCACKNPNVSLDLTGNIPLSVLHSLIRLIIGEGALHPSSPRLRAPPPSHCY
jgi:hypothetical protein